MMRLIIGDYILRPICEEDLSTVLRWRNSDRIRSKMLQQHIITWDEHIRWFKRLKKNKTPMNFILEYKYKPIGYAGFSYYDDEKKSCYSGKYIGEVDDVPVDAGIVLGYLMDVYMYDILKVETTVGSTLRSNKRVLKQNLKGAKILKTDDDVIWYSHKKDEWDNNKKVLVNYIDEELIIDM